MTTEKRVKIAYLFSFTILIFQFVDVFFIHDGNSVFASNIISRIIGSIIAGIVSTVMGLNLKRSCFKSYGAVFEVLYGSIFSVIPIIVVFAVKYFYFRFKSYDNLVLTFRPSGFAKGQENEIFLVILYVLTILLIAAFKEVFYRGFLITQLSSKYGVYKAIIIQSVIYSISFVPSLLKFIVTGRFDSQGPIMTVFLVIGHLFYNFLCGLKWGMYYKVNGTVWMSVADHFLNNFLITSFFLTENRLPQKWYVIEVIMIQLLSFIIFMPFYLHRDKINEMAAEEFALNKEALKMGIDDYAPSVVRKKIGEIVISKENIDEVEKRISDLQFEEPIAYDSGQFLTEENLTFSVHGHEIDDGKFEHNTEIYAHGSDPSLKSKEFFDNLVGKNSEKVIKSKESVDNENSTNADNISKLVKNYFDQNFDKHTFTK